MKRIIALVMTSLLLLSMGTLALAEDSAHTLSFSGTVVANHAVSILAPFGGALEDYTLRVGDKVRTGDTLFFLHTTPVYAPIDGTVGNLRAQPGDDAAFLGEQYGGLLYIVPTSIYQIAATTKNAFDNNDNRIVNIGETVYLKSINSNARTGEGFIAAVEGTSYTVEVTGGNLDIAEDVRIYRAADYGTSSRIGDGKTQRIDPIPVQAEGSILNIHVREGEEVKRGDLLAEMVSGALSARANTTSNVRASTDGVIGSILVEAGAVVEKDAVFATLLPLGSAQIAVNVLESDLHALQVGTPVTIDFVAGDIVPATVGVVASVSSVSNTETGDAEYTVYVDFEDVNDVKFGMNVTVGTK